MAEIKRMFTPEFRNRLDAIISFAALDHDIILRVVDKFLMQLEEQLHEKKVEASFTDALKDYLAKKRLRSADGRAADGAPDPGHASAARWPTSCCSAGSRTAARSRSTSTTTTRSSLRFRAAEAPAGAPATEPDATARP